MNTYPSALIAEDEEPQRRELRALLAELWPELAVVAECQDGLAALEALHNMRPDIAFLDIRMPGVSGLEVADQASTIALVVLVTAFDEFAVSAFETGAVDYVLKPVKRDRLEVTIERLRQRLADGQRADVAGALTTLRAALDARQPQEINWISASVGDTIKLMSIDDVLFFRSEDKYTRVVTADATAHIRTPLKDLLAQIDPEVFWQVHRSVIVRVSAIRALRRDGDGRLRLAIAGISETLPVSASFHDRFKPM